MTLVLYQISLYRIMASVADPQAAKNIQTILKDLGKNLKKVETARKSAEIGLESIKSQHSDIESEGVLSVTSQGKLLKSYHQAISEADREDRMTRTLIAGVILL